MALTTYLQNSIPQNETYLKNGFTQDVAGVQFPLQSGVPVQPIYMFDVIPAAFSVNCISAANVWFPEGQPLNQRNTGSGNDVITIALNDSNPLVRNKPYFATTGILLDCERTLTLTFSNPPETQPDTYVIFTGFDYLGKSVVSKSELPYGTNNKVFEFYTPMLVVTSVVIDDDFGAGGGVTLQIGNGTRIGLPYLLTQPTFFIGGSYGATPLTINNMIAGTVWRNPDALVGIESDAQRGLVTLPSASDGTTMLTCCYYVYGADSSLAAEVGVLNQSSLKVAGIEISQGDQEQEVLPFMTRYDVTGIAYPGDNAFMYQYNQLMAS